MEKAIIEPIVKSLIGDQPFAMETEKKQRSRRFNRREKAHRGQYDFEASEVLAGNEETSLGEGANNGPPLPDDVAREGRPERPSENQDYGPKWDDLFSGAPLFRTFDGSSNNLANADWGSTHTQLIRLSDPAYEDGIYEPRGGFESVLPSPRAISNAIAAQDGSMLNQARLSDWFWQWGQFIDHDIGLTEPGHPPEAFYIPVPKGDPYFDPFRTGESYIALNRSIYDANTGTSADNPRQQINEITAYVDGSMVYGSDQAMADFLRTHEDGKLKTSMGANGEVLLPKPDGSPFFIAGDIRANEQIGLTAAHTLFVREHNRLAGQIGTLLDKGNHKALNRLYHETGLDADEFIYQSARRIVGAKIQTITYNEFLPLLIGDALEDYTGYDPNVNAGMTTEFSTAAFRVGHTMLSPQLLRVEKNRTVEKIALRDAFFQPDEVTENGIDSLLRGLGSQRAQAIDPMIIDDVRNFLFGPPGRGGFDLASLNIQRGRDHGIADINTVREALGLEAYEDFDDLTGGDMHLADHFASVYGSIDDVDLWIGGLAEPHVPGAVVGETFQHIIADQFANLRDGDRFWYEHDPYLNVFKGMLDHRTTLSQVIKDNSTVKDMQGNAFMARPIAPLGEVIGHELA